MIPQNHEKSRVTAFFRQFGLGRLLAQAGLRSRTIGVPGSLSRVYDHVEHRYRWGFRGLTVGWSDGTTFLPLIFSFVGSHKASNRRRDTESQVDKRSVGARRRREALESAPTLVVRALRDALQVGITARYVLFDRWFTTGQ